MMIATALLLAALPIGKAATPDRTRISQPLKGITTMYGTFYVNDPDHLVKMTDDDVVSHISQGVSKTGIELATKDEFDRYNSTHTTKMPEFFVMIFINAATGDQPKSCSVNVSLSDTVKLARNHDISFETEVWTNGSDGELSGDDAAPVEEAIDKCLRQFASDYALANSKK